MDKKEERMGALTWYRRMKFEKGKASTGAARLFRYDGGLWLAGGARMVALGWWRSDGGAHSAIPTNCQRLFEDNRTEDGFRA